MKVWFSKISLRKYPTSPYVYSSLLCRGDMALDPSHVPSVGEVIEGLELQSHDISARSHPQTTDLSMAIGTLLGRDVCAQCSFRLRTDRD